MSRFDLSRAASVISVVLLMASTANAQDTSGWKYDGLSRWSNSKTGNEFKLRGRVYVDYANIRLKNAGVRTSINDGEFRTRRIGIQGKAGIIHYVAGFDFSNSKISAKDAKVSLVGDNFKIVAGNMKTPNSLEEQTSSRYISFMERGTGTDLFGLDRRIGLAASTGGDRYSFKAGVYGGKFGDLGETTRVDDSSAVAARFTYAPIKTDQMIVHLGASFRYLDYGGAGTRIRARPRAHLANRIFTADFRPGKALGQANSSTFWGVEAAMLSGPFHLQGEYMILDVSGPKSTPVFDSLTVSAGYFLTGEMRKYKASAGSFKRTSPARSLSEGGYGAWEIAARYDYSNLNDVAAGELTTWTLGLNWYVENHFRVMANYVLGDLNVNGSSAAQADVAQVRMQWGF